jgi:restriction system protein
MAIPDFQTVMPVLLAHLSDGKEYTNEETLDSLAESFALSPEERVRLLPSGKQQVLKNRVAWAKTHLKQAGLVESSRRGVFRISDRGRQALQNNQEPINMRFLKQFPEYLEFRARSSSEEEPTSDSETTDLTPEEQVEYGYERLRKQLSAELLRKIKDCQPDFFEKLVIDLLLAMGYGGSRADAGRAVGRSGDGGIDGIIKEDRLGLDTIFVQAKCWDGTVGRPEIQKFAGALQGQRAKKGIFITTSEFSREAEAFASMIDSKIVLINGTQLASFMIEHDIGVAPVASYEVKRIDSDYFTPGE